MAKSYQALYEQGQLHWLDKQPNVQKAHVIVTVLDTALPEDSTRAERIHRLLEQTRGAWGHAKTADTAALDAEVMALRDEWQRPWEPTEASSSK